MILSDRDIRAAMQRLEDPLIISPHILAQRLQPASLELTLGDSILMNMSTGPSVFHETQWTELSLKGYGLVEWEPDAYALAPGQFILASTAETVHIPRDLVAQVNGKSTWARKGLIVHTTAGFIDPGFRGQITLELFNVGEEYIILPMGAPICQLVFYQMTSPSERPYGSEGLGSHYQDQRGPTRPAEAF